MKHVIFLIISFLATAANALDFEVGLGQAQHSKPPNTQYWQQEFPNTWDLTSPAYYVGISGYVAPGWKLRAGWLDLGNTRSEAWATSDVNYQEGVGCINPCPILGRWTVEQRTKGVEFSVAREFGPFFLKAGVLIHRPRVDVYIYRGPGDTARTHFNYPEQLNYAPTLGAGWTTGKWDVSVNWYKIDATTDSQVEEERIPPGTGNDTLTLMVRRAF